MKKVTILSLVNFKNVINIIIKKNDGFSEWISLLRKAVIGEIYESNLKYKKTGEKPKVSELIDLHESYVHSNARIDIFYSYKKLSIDGSRCVAVKSILVPSPSLLSRPVSKETSSFPR